MRVKVEKGDANLDEECDIMIDQVRAIDNKRLIKKAGSLSSSYRKKIKENLSIVLNL
ncbi:MAG: type II toxin-antitoxin system PemK/MazF family toxin [Balneolaceae bacterium]